MSVPSQRRAPAAFAVTGFVLLLAFLLALTAASSGVTSRGHRASRTPMRRPTAWTRCSRDDFLAVLPAARARSVAP